jgi:hypothetical protein
MAERISPFDPFVNRNCHDLIAQTPTDFHNDAPLAAGRAAGRPSHAPQGFDRKPKRAGFHHFSMSS